MDTDGKTQTKMKTEKFCAKAGIVATVGGAVYKVRGRRLARALCALLYAHTQRSGSKRTVRDLNRTSFFPVLFA